MRITGSCSAGTGLLPRMTNTGTTPREATVLTILLTPTLDTPRQDRMIEPVQPLARAGN